MKAYISNMILLTLIAIMQGLSTVMSGTACPQEWINRADGLRTAFLHRNCYLLLKPKLTYDEARYECWSKQGYLTESHRGWYTAIVNTFGVDDVWTGFNDRAQEGQFRANYNNHQTVKVDWRPWHRFAGRRNNCVAFRTSTGFTEFKDENCQKKYHAICQFGNDEGYPWTVDRSYQKGLCSAGYSRTNAVSRSCFKVFTHEVPQQEASKLCKQQGFRLARLQTFQGALAARGDQLTLVAYLARGAGNLWVGDSPCTQYVHSTRKFVLKQNCAVARPYVCEQVLGYEPFRYQNKHNKRCPINSFIQSLPNEDYTTTSHVYSGSVTEMVQLCSRVREHKLAIPDEATMHCLYDAMKAILRFFPSFASSDSGPLLMPFWKGNLKFMNQHGYQSDPVRGKSYRILCAIQP